MPKIIAITGTDGSGKSSVLEGLKERFPEAAVGEIWQPMYGENSPFSSKQAVDQYICQLNPEARTLFLSHALMESTQNALKQASELVFLNAYYFKYFVSEKALGTDSKILEQLTAFFPKPDLTIRLMPSLEIISGRKERYSRYECGLQEPTAENFHAFQEKCLEHWDLFGNQIDITLENTGTLDQTLDEICKLISQ
jgi:thymidylate kinase